MILAGDIGGTKTTLALFAATRGTAPGFERATATVGNYASRDFAEFHEILRDFLARHRPQLVAGCIGIAGPVRENRCTTTNLPWTVGGAELARLAGLDELRLINDLEAVGYGIDLLAPAGDPRAPAGSSRRARQSCRDRRRDRSRLRAMELFAPLGAEAGDLGASGWSASPAVSTSAAARRAALQGRGPSSRPSSPKAACARCSRAMPVRILLNTRTALLGAARCTAMAAKCSPPPPRAHQVHPHEDQSATNSQSRLRSATGVK